ncbi:MAG: ABC transporter permease [Clostridia bacterium]|nr:ABC transporter permease [Clostridia bacterium]
MSNWKSIWKRLKRHKLAAVGFGVFCTLVITAIIVPCISPYRIDDMDLMNVFSPPSRVHPFGSDELGHDVLVRIMYGGRISLFVGVAAAVSSALVGTLIGVVSGFVGGMVDGVLMRFTDLMLSVPTLPVLLIGAMFLGGGLANIIVILTIFGWMSTARLVRGMTLSLREQPFVEAARASGSKTGRILWKHMLPNLFPIVIVSATLGVSSAILAESALSYLGLGIQPPTPSWGNMLQRSMDYILGAGGDYGRPWWLTVFPGLFVLLAVLSVNFMGDGLRDALDPRMVVRTASAPEEQISPAQENSES